jgi:hypothetical protein
MEDYRMTTSTATGAHRRARRALVAWGLWLRAGVVGVAALAAGPVLAFNGDIRPTSALALVLGGGVLAALSWSRLRGALVQGDAPESGRATVRCAVGDRGGRTGRELLHAAGVGAE